MDKISQMLFDALTGGGSLADLRTAMTEYETTYHRSLKSVLVQPAFRKLWAAMAEACAYENQNAEAEAFKNSQK